jgi:arylsulfatase
LLFALSVVGAVPAGAEDQVKPQAAPAAPAGSKPNILVIWGDDIGQGNISAYTKGLMGYRTPNIDRAT